VDGVLHVNIPADRIVDLDILHNFVLDNHVPASEEEEEGDNMYFVGPHM
jgi:hypothetical protein